MINSRFLFTWTRYPIIEVLFALISGLVATLTDSSNQPVFSFVLYAMSGVVGLIFRPFANHTSLRKCWIYFAVGIAIILIEVLYLGRIETGILDIFLMPVGLGILFAAIGSVLHRLSSTSSATNTHGHESSPGQEH